MSRPRLLGLGLIVLLLVQAALAPVLVHCTAAEGHSAVEWAGHALESLPVDGTCCSDAEHDHHPADCQDTELDGEATLPRIQQQAAADAFAPVAILLPPSPLLSLRILDPAREPQRCAQPPPDLRRSIDELATVILLI